jgi:predicted peptidase
MTARRGLIMLALTSALMLTWPASARLDGEMFLSRSITIGTTDFQFRVFTPKGWSRKKKSPVILFLHGAGERGDDNLVQTKVGIGPALIRQQETLPFIVVLPQCPRNRWWTEPDMQAQALKALEQTVKEFNGDPQRTYLTGLSMGGYGSWIMASGNPSLFAGIAVVCGGVRPPPRVNVPQPTQGPSTAADPYAAVAAMVGKTPVWIFHGGADPVVPVSESRKMADAIKAAGGNPRYSEYEGVGHNSWDKAYAEPEIFSWMLAQKLKLAKR